LYCRRVVIASDCKGVVEDIQKGNSGRNESIVKEIGVMAKEFDSCSFIFEERASNMEAYGLAKHALSLDVGRYLWLIHTPLEHAIPVNIINQ
jgi:hypothetical protein